MSPSQYDAADRMNVHSAILMPQPNGSLPARRIVDRLEARPLATDDAPRTLTVPNPIATDDRLAVRTASQTPPRTPTRLGPAVIGAMIVHSGLLALVMTKVSIAHIPYAGPIPTPDKPLAFHLATASEDEHGDGMPGTGGNSGQERTVTPTPTPPSSMTATPPPIAALPLIAVVSDDTANQHARHLTDITANQPPSDAPFALVAASGTATNGLSAGLGTGSATGFGRPSYLHNPPPQYPRVAREHGWQGTAVLQVEVLDDGHGGKIAVVQSSGHRVLDDAAVETVRQWQFVPARNGDMAIRSVVEVPISFRMLNN